LKPPDPRFEAGEFAAPDDALVRRHLELAREFSTDPPPDWRGVLTMAGK
jgi:hypothetical protein